VSNTKNPKEPPLSGLGQRIADAKPITDYFQAMKDLVSESASNGSKWLTDAIEAPTPGGAAVLYRMAAGQFELARKGAMGLHRESLKRAKKTP